MKSQRQLAVSACCSFAAFVMVSGLSACNNIPANSSNPATQSLVSTPMVPAKASVALFPTPVPPPLEPVPPPLEDVPLYPGAFDINNDKVYYQDWRRTRYKVEGTSHEVVAFYKTQLSQEGWVLDKEYWSGFRATLLYKWEDSAQVVPWDLDLSLEVSQDNVLAYVDLNLSRIPNLDRIPLYRDPQQIKVKQVPSTRWGASSSSNILHT